MATGGISTTIKLPVESGLETAADLQLLVSKLGPVFERTIPAWPVITGRLRLMEFSSKRHQELDHFSWVYSRRPCTRQHSTAI